MTLASNSEPGRISAGLTSRQVLGVAMVLGLAGLGLLRFGGRLPGATTRELRAVHGATMGTTYVVKVVCEDLDEAALARLHKRVQDTLDAVDARMSTYRMDSELSRFNRLRSTEPFSMSASTLAVFATAERVSEISKGAFDVTVAPLVNAWGFGPARGERGRPSEQQLAALRARVGYRHLELDAEASTLRKKIPEVQCDLSAIAKGYAVDEVAEMLLRGGHDSFMVEVGGEVRARGRNLRGIPWQIAVEIPDATQRAVYDVVDLDGLALATSGDYRNYRELDGVRYSHTIDPRTGRPITHRLASVSVVSDKAVLADAFATALNVMGPEEGLKLAESQDMAVLFIMRGEGGGFEHRATAAFGELRSDAQRNQAERQTKHPAKTTKEP